MGSSMIFLHELSDHPKGIGAEPGGGSVPSLMLLGDRVNAFTVLPFRGGEGQPHLLAQSAADEATNRMRLPGSRSHNLLQGGTTGRFDVGTNRITDTTAFDTNSLTSGTTIGRNPKLRLFICWRDCRRVLLQPGINTRIPTMRRAEDREPGNRSRNGTQPGLARVSG